ncbi:MAG: PAP/fibrillin family protein [Cyanobacteria bacterium J06560_6]
MLSKNDLKNAIAAKNRGLSATIADKQVIASTIARVEDLNPTPDPLSAPELLAGDWRLLYTTSQELLGIDRFPLATLGNIYQCIRPQHSRIYNIAELKGLPYLDGLVSVVANFTPADTAGVGASVSSRAEAETVGAGGTAVAIAPKNRVNVSFSRAVIGLQGTLGYQNPAQYIETLEANAKLNLLRGIDFSINAQRQQGWLEITYLDEDFRIGRGNQGSLFVLTKDPSN